MDTDAMTAESLGAMSEEDRASHCGPVLANPSGYADDLVSVCSNR